MRHLKLTQQTNPNGMKLLQALAYRCDEWHTLKEWTAFANIPCLSGYLKMAEDYAPYFGVRIDRKEEPGKVFFKLAPFGHRFLEDFEWDED